MSSKSKIKVPIARTALSESEMLSVLEPLRNGWLVQGPKVAEFEKKWSEFVNVPHSAAVTSCTTGLHISLSALRFAAGDEAIVPAFTWISTANVVEHLGGKVVFCDIDPSTFNIDTTQIEEKITSRTKVILPVHLFGLSANMDPILHLAKKYDLKIVEDAACGFGTYYNKEHVGNFGDMACFSFHPRKSITTGEGGMITSSNGKLIDRVRQLRDHGAIVSDLQRHLGPQPYLLADHTEAGFNQRMTDIQAALGSAQMDRAQEIVAERQRLARKYDAAFSNIEWLKIPTVPINCIHGYQSYACTFAPEEINLDNFKAIHQRRNKWMKQLQEAGIATRPATHAVHMLTYYKEKYALAETSLPNACIANDCSISLPLFHGMTSEEQDYVIANVLDAKI